MIPIFVFALLLSALPPAVFGQSSADSLRNAGENHLSNIRQLTFGGENAEAYFSTDGKRLIFQSTRDSFQCDQIYAMTLLGEDVQLLSSGSGRATCAYFLPGDTTFIYSSTERQGHSCPPRPDYSKGYVWAVYPGYDIYRSFTTNINSTRLTDSTGYDAEATVSPRGDRIVFTSIRNGDLDIYSMKLDGTEIEQLTHTIGYDGGAFISPDGSKIVYRGYHPATAESRAEYLALLGQNLVRPSAMELFLMNSDGSNNRQITSFGGANFAPYFHPDGDKIIFASNMHDPKGRNFELYLINTDGSGLERITFHERFDGFPVFSRDGKHLVFASNRNGKKEGETNIFIADWVP